MVRPWAEAGYECWCVDVQHKMRSDRVEKFESGGSIIFAWGDARSWTPLFDITRLKIGFGFPPCTDVALSDARDFQKKRGWCLSDALQIFDSCHMALSYTGKPFMLENPKSRFSTHRREPDHKFQPWNYGDLYLKETWLWTGGGFEMPEFIHHVKPDGVQDLIHKMSPGKDNDRADKRSITPVNFAMAVFKANTSGIKSTLL